MSKPASPWIASRASFAATVIAIAFAMGWFLAPSGHTQAPATTTNNAALNALLNKVKTQQDDMAANQTKIEAQTAQLEETLHQAKIYSARSGAGHR